jgi:hypothetical protein
MKKLYKNFSNLLFNSRFIKKEGAGEEKTGSTKLVEKNTEEKLNLLQEGLPRDENLSGVAGEALKKYPQETVAKNLKKELKNKIGPAKTLTKDALKIVGEFIRLTQGSLEAVDRIIREVADIGLVTLMKTDRPLGDLTVLSTRTKQEFDEFTTSAALDEHLAMSDFYKNNPQNRLMYKLQLDYANKKTKPLYLGLFKGMSGYVSDLYNKKSGDNFFTDLKSYYNEWVRDNKPIPGIDAILKKRIQQEQKG